VSGIAKHFNAGITVIMEDRRHVERSPTWTSVPPGLCDRCGLCVETRRSLRWCPC